MNRTKCEFGITLRALIEFKYLKISLLSFRLSEERVTRNLKSDKIPLHTSFGMTYRFFVVYVKILTIN
ncbi:hypothetical protein GCM10023311_23360 [Flaviramulus aquimarinus]|uniref:Uncharacterized protein n=1 Tax=Flaviramulus aquimarinus TaxID=1170456 RepID=A0ABP9FE42_9FLAO